MPIIDPWSGFNQGTQTLRQVTQDQMTNKIGKMKIQEAEQDQAFKAGLRELETLMARDNTPEDQKSKMRIDYATKYGKYDYAKDMGSLADLQNKGERRDIAAIDTIAKLKGSPLLKDPAFRARITSAYGISDAALIDIMNEKVQSPEDKMRMDLDLWSKKQDILNEKRDERDAARAAREAQKGASPSYMGLDPQYGSVFKLEGKDGLYVMDANSGKFVTRLEAEALNKEKKFKPYNMIPGARADISGYISDPNKDIKEVRAEAIDVKADAKSLEKQQATYDSMNSFVRNMNKQIDRVKPLAQDLMTFDAALLNMPLRAIRNKIAGSPLQSKYDMYLASIESEIGKLATGSTGSVRELSKSAQEKWDKIHNKNLSVADMLEVLEETRNEADMRLTSQAETVQDIKDRLRGETTPEPKKKEAVPSGSAKPKAETDAAAEAKAAVLMKSSMFQNMPAGDRSVAQEVTIDDGSKTGLKVKFYKKENGKVGFIPIAGGR